MSRPRFLATGSRGQNLRPWRPLDELFDGMLSAAGWKTSTWFDVSDDDELEELGHVHHEVLGEWEDPVWMEMLWRKSCENLRDRDPELEPVTNCGHHHQAVLGRFARG